MQGYHEVRIFDLPSQAQTEPLKLPPGWKPFGVLGHGAIVARRWCRLDEKNEPNGY